MLIAILFRIYKNLCTVEMECNIDLSLIVSELGEISHRKHVLRLASQLVGVTLQYSFISVRAGAM